MAQNIEKNLHKHEFIYVLSTRYSHSKALPETIGQQNFVTRTEDLELHIYKTNAVKGNTTSVPGVTQQLAKQKSHYAILALRDELPRMLALH